MHPETSTEPLPATTASNSAVVLPAKTNFDVLPSSIAGYARRIATLAKGSTEQTIEMCAEFHKAKTLLDERDFEALCASLKYKPDSSTIKKYILIGERAESFRPYLDNLPNTWTTLYEITRLDEESFRNFMEKGQITQQTTGLKIKSLIAKSSGITAPPPKDPPPRIVLHLPEHVSRERIRALVSELEAIRMDPAFEFTFELNSTASKIA